MASEERRMWLAVGAGALVCCVSGVWGWRQHGAASPTDACRRQAEDQLKKCAVALAWMTLRDELTLSLLTKAVEDCEHVGQTGGGDGREPTCDRVADGGEQARAGHRPDITISVKRFAASVERLSTRVMSVCQKQSASTVRFDELDTLIDTLTWSPAPGCVAVQGGRGVGKSTLCVQLCAEWMQDTELMKKYPDGPHLVQVGSMGCDSETGSRELHSLQELLLSLNRLYDALWDSPDRVLGSRQPPSAHISDRLLPTTSDWETRRENSSILEAQFEDVCGRIRSLLSNQKCLVILDGVSTKQADVVGKHMLAPGSLLAAVVVTSRDDVSEHLQAQAVSFELKPSEDVRERVLALYATEDGKLTDTHKEDGIRILKAVGHNCLLLRLIGQELRPPNHSLRLEQPSWGLVADAVMEMPTDLATATDLRAYLAVHKAHTIMTDDFGHLPHLKTLLNVFELFSVGACLSEAVMYRVWCAICVGHGGRPSLLPGRDTFQEHLKALLSVALVERFVKAPPFNTAGIHLHPTLCWQLDRERRNVTTTWDHSVYPALERLQSDRPDDPCPALLALCCIHLLGHKDAACLAKDALCKSPNVDRGDWKSPTWWESFTSRRVFTPSVPALLEALDEQQVPGATMTEQQQTVQQLLLSAVTGCIPEEVKPQLQPMLGLIHTAPMVLAIVIGSGQEDMPPLKAGLTELVANVEAEPASMSALATADVMEQVWMALFLELRAPELALPVVQRVVRLREKMLGANHILTRSAELYKAGTLDECGKKVLSKAALFTSGARNRMRMQWSAPEYALEAHRLHGLGQFEQAVVCGEKSLLVHSELKGKAHPETISCLRMLAWTMYRLGRYDDALDRFVEVSARRVEALGSQHYLTQLSQAEVGVAYEGIGSHRDALQLKERCMRELSRQLGTQHPVCARLQRSQDISRASLRDFAPANEDEAQQGFTSGIAYDGGMGSRALAGQASSSGRAHEVQSAYGAGQSHQQEQSPVVHYTVRPLVELELELPLQPLTYTMDSRDDQEQHGGDQLLRSITGTGERLSTRQRWAGKGASLDVTHNVMHCPPASGTLAMQMFGHSPGCRALLEDAAATKAGHVNSISSKKMPASTDSMKFIADVLGFWRQCTASWKAGPCLVGWLQMEMARVAESACAVLGQIQERVQHVCELEWILVLEAHCIVESAAALFDSHKRSPFYKRLLKLFQYQATVSHWLNCFRLRTQLLKILLTSAKAQQNPEFVPVSAHNAVSRFIHSAQAILEICSERRSTGHQVVPLLRKVDSDMFEIQVQDSDAMRDAMRRELGSIMASDPVLSGLLSSFEWSDAAEQVGLSTDGDGGDREEQLGGLGEGVSAVDSAKCSGEHDVSPMHSENKPMMAPITVRCPVKQSGYTMRGESAPMRFLACSHVASRASAEGAVACPVCNTPVAEDSVAPDVCTLRLLQVLPEIHDIPNVYRTRKVLGTANNGSVFLGRYEEQDVAVKVVNVNYFSSDSLYSAVQEVAVTQAISSASGSFQQLVAVAWTARGAELVLQLCDSSLRQVVEGAGGQLPATDVSLLLLELLTAMLALHNHNPMVQRDVAVDDVFVHQKRVCVAVQGASARVKRTPPDQRASGGLGWSPTFASVVYDIGAAAVYAASAVRIRHSGKAVKDSIGHNTCIPVDFPDDLHNLLEHMTSQDSTQRPSLVHAQREALLVFTRLAATAPPVYLEPVYQCVLAPLKHLSSADDPGGALRMAAHRTLTTIRKLARTVKAFPQECHTLATQLGQATVQEVLSGACTAVEQGDSHQMDLLDLLDYLGDMLATAEYCVRSCQANVLAASPNILSEQRIEARLRQVMTDVAAFAWHANAKSLQERLHHLQQQANELPTCHLRSTIMRGQQQRPCDGVVLQHADRLVPELAEQLDTEKCPLLGIVGMVGIGKTALARAVLGAAKGNFDRVAFVPVGQACNGKQVLQQAWEELLPSFPIPDHPAGTLVHEMATRLHSQKLLVVFDDVWSSHMLQLVNFARLYGHEEHQGSNCVIVTTRDASVLQAQQKGQEWHVVSPPALDSIHSRQLLCQHAFRQPEVPAEYEVVVRKVLEKARGLPLMLVLLGRDLRGQSVGVWSARLQMLGSTDTFGGEVDEIRRLVERSVSPLPPLLRRCFTVFGALPEGGQVKEADLLSIFSSICPFRPSTTWAQQQLHWLRAKHLIELCADGRRFAMHDVSTDSYVPPRLALSVQCQRTAGAIAARGVVLLFVPNAAADSDRPLVPVAASGVGRLYKPDRVADHHRPAVQVAASGVSGVCGLDSVADDHRPAVQVAALGVGDMSTVE